MKDNINGPIYLTENELLHLAAGQTGLLKYSCRSATCRMEIICKRPVDITCNRCGKSIVGVDII